MTKVQRMTLDEIRDSHPGCYVESFDAGLVSDGDEQVNAQDVIVWATEADAEGDDGTNAIARYRIPC
jgi:hypothetical protein